MCVMHLYIHVYYTHINALCIYIVNIHMYREIRKTRIGISRNLNFNCKKFYTYLKNVLKVSTPYYKMQNKSKEKRRLAPFLFYFIFLESIKF